MSHANSFVVFLSYSRKDEHLQLTIEQAVGGLPGVRVWSDTMIGAGESIHDNIEKAINQSDCVLVLFTQAAAHSPEVREELVRADVRRIPIVVVKEASVEERQIPYFLRDRRYLSYDESALQVRNLIDAIRRVVVEVKERAVGETQSAGSETPA